MLSTVRHSVLRQSKSAICSPSSVGGAQRTAFARLLSTLAILEQREGQLLNASLSTVTAAQKLGGSIAGFVAGSNVKSVAEQAAKVEGLDKIIMVENGAYDKVDQPVSAFRYHRLADQVPTPGTSRELCTSTCREH